MHFMRFGEKLGALLMVEAAFAGAYVSITRGFFYLMMVERGYSVRDLAVVSLVASLSMVLVSYLLYRRPELLERSVKVKLLTMHILERIFWCILPFIVFRFSYMFILLAYSLAQVITVPVCVLLNTVLLSQLSEDEFKSVTGWRNSLGLISSLSAQLLAVHVLASMRSPVRYYYLYTIALLLGFLSWIPLTIARVRDYVRKVSGYSSEEVEVIAGTTFIYLVLLLGSANMLSILWVPYLVNDLGAPSYLVAIMNAAGTISGSISSVLWIRVVYRYYLCGLVIDSAVPTLVMTLPPIFHPALAGLSAFGFTAGNFIGYFMYSKIAEKSDPIKNSTRLAAANALGLLISLIPVAILNLSARDGLILCSCLKVLALVIALLSIKEVSPLPDPRIRTYSKVIFETGMFSYRLTLEFTTHYVLYTLKIVAVVLIMLFMYFIYRTVTILISGA